MSEQFFSLRLAGICSAMLCCLVSVAALAQTDVAPDPILRGAIDIHAHLDPDGYGPGGNGRSVNVLEMAERARESGMRGFVIKQHYDQSADSAYIVRELYPDLEVFGGIGTNFATGGMNPYAIRQMADVKGGWGRIVWMPTWDAEHYVREHGNDRPFISVARDGRLLPETETLIRTIAEVTGNTRVSGGDLIIATGHNAPEEGLLMVELARSLGVTVVVTHPLLYSVGMNFEQMQQAADMGAYLELVSSFTRTPETIAEHAEAIRQIGAEHFIVSSDRGQGVGPEGHERETGDHVVGLTLAAQALREAGISERELELMFRENPARLLGLPVK